MKYKFEMDINGCTDLYWLNKRKEKATENYMKHHHECYYCFDTNNCKKCKLRKILEEIK